MKDWKEFLNSIKQNNLNWEGIKYFADRILSEFVRRLSCMDEVLPGFVHAGQIMIVCRELSKELEAK